MLMGMHDRLMSDCCLHGLKLFFTTHLPAAAVTLCKCAAVFTAFILYVTLKYERVKL